ncbi:MAG TPA: M1 family aminopeptidase [Gemmatimonadaceae bacterium]|nr:M1 family aminopeptidase [Gemmatimonadaceae bacterium]
MPTLALLAAAVVAALPSLPATAATGARPDSLTVPGVSRALAAYRAAHVSRVRYDLRLDVTAHDTARGHVTVRFVRRGGGDAILDFRGLALGGARANGQSIAGLASDGAHVRVPAAALRAGENALEFDFAAAIAPAGASVIRFHDTVDGADYLYTLLVPADANALFPCFDQPDLKARVKFALRVPRGWTAVANGALRDSIDDGGARTFRFAETRPISTYLIAFAAGPWATRTRTVSGRRMTMYVRASRAAEAETDSLVDANARAIGWLERYFARPYPFGKFDFVLAPAFPFGGMEHPGAVFYNEESFIYRERPTLTQRLGRTATIYHEVAHQWFGDYVTMKWFDDLWLKEGFATYMAAKMQDALDPRSQAWKTFYLRNKPVAYAVDVTEGTTPVWQQLANLDQAKSNYGAIVYNKAPGVLKQLNYLVGDSAFRVGLQRYLARHAYGNATWRDLLGAVGEAAHRDLTAWGNQYILRPGVPALVASPVEFRGECASSALLHSPTGTSVTSSCRGPLVARVTVEQRAMNGAVPGGGGPWRIGTQLLAWGLKDSLPQRLPLELTGKLTSVTLPNAVSYPALLFPNADDYAYAVTLLDSASVEWTEQRIGSVDDAFLRAMLWGSLWDLVREARLDPTRFVALAERELPRERDEQIAASTLGHVAYAAEHYLAGGRRDSLAPALEATLLDAAYDTTRSYGIRKSHLDALVGIASTPATLARLDALLDSAAIAGIPLRAPTRWAIVTTLVEHATPSAERRLAEETRRDSTTEGKRRAFVAGAARPTAESKRAYFERYFADRALNEDWATASLAAFNAPAQQSLTLPYLVPALDSLPWVQKNRRIFYLGSWLGAFLGGQTSAEAEARVDEFLRAHPGLPVDLRQKLLQSADELRRTVAIRKAYGGA